MKDKWRVGRINLRFIDFGEDAGKYTGSIEFEKGREESFKFKIQPDMASKYIELLADDIVNSADNLAQDLVKSLGLRDNNTRAGDSDG